MILVESPNPLITKEAHQYKKADLDPASGVALHTTEVALGSTCLSFDFSILKRNHQRSKVHRRFEDARPEGRGWEVVRPVHQVLPLQGPIILKRRV